VDRTSEVYLRDALSRFGQIDCVDMLPQKKIAFVHFASITSAITCKEALQADPQWASFKLNYGKDRCNADLKGRSHGDSKSSGGGGGAVQRYSHQSEDFGGYRPSGFGGPPPQAANFGGYGGGFGAGYAAPAQPSFGGGFGNTGNRTVYLGGVTEEFAIKDILDNVHGGLIDQVRILPEKKCCFLSFVDPAVAQQFFARTSTNGFYVGEKTCKVGWGKTKPIPQAVVDGLRRGATRNLFIGNIDPGLTAEKLHADLAQFGAIEKLDILAAKKIAFVHFTSIADAMKAADALKAEGTGLHEAYAGYRINFGKDRCSSLTARSSRPAVKSEYGGDYGSQDGYGYQNQGFS